MAASEPLNTLEQHGSWIYSRTAMVTICVVLILGFLIYTGHSAHLLGVAPYLLILACPLMHIFMHSGHGGHHGDSAEKKENVKEAKTPEKECH